MLILPKFFTALLLVLIFSPISTLFSLYLFLTFFFPITLAHTHCLAPLFLIAQN